MTDEDLISIWKKIIDERSKLNEKIESLKEKLKENESKYSENSSDIKHLENKLISIQVFFFLFITFWLLFLRNLILTFKTHLNKRSGRSSNEVVEVLEEFEKMKLHDSLSRIRTLISDIIRHNLNTQSDIENALQLLHIDVDNNYG